MSTPEKQKQVVIAGGGPAGLTAAHLLQGEAQVSLYEKSEMLGGISRTVAHHGNHIDIGGHRFFSKSSRVNDFWREVMPGMLTRPRVSRIYFLRRFFDYPVRLTPATLRRLGFKRTLRAGIGYIKSMLRKRPELSLEDFYINRFGRPLYETFFEGFTEKVWGKHPSQLSADWGAQRVKGLSLWGLVKDFVSKRMPWSSRREVETSLIERFKYPPLGPGQLWETVGAQALEAGAKVELNTGVERIHLERGRVVGVTVRGADGVARRVECDEFISSMPVSELIAALDGIDVPEDVRRVAAALPYRDFITVGLLVNRLKIKSENGRGLIPDTWIYVQDSDVRLGRIQVFNNWSPRMVADPERHVWLGLEYFCNEGDELWEMTDDEMIQLAAAELAKIGIIDSSEVTDAVRIRMPKAYPAYFGSYGEFDKVRAFLDTIPNLWCVGRNGQHRYNNMDHSMLTAMEAADRIAAGDTDKAPLWNVNTDAAYHED